MKLQVFTTITSASDACGVSSCPWDVSWPIITSVSTRFFGHPRLTKPIFKRFLNVAVRLAALFQILLMIFFGAPEIAGGDDLRDDGPGETRLRGLAGAPGLHQLLRRIVENRGAVLRARVRTLPVTRGRIMIVPKRFEQIVVTEHLRIEGDLHN